MLAACVWLPSKRLTLRPTNNWLADINRPGVWVVSGGVTTGELQRGISRFASRVSFNLVLHHNYYLKKYD